MCFQCTYSLIRFPHALLCVVCIVCSSLILPLLRSAGSLALSLCVWETRWPMYGSECVLCVRFALSLFHSNVFVMFLFSSLKMFKNIVVVAANEQRTTNCWLENSLYARRTAPHTHSLLDLTLALSFGFCLFVSFFKWNLYKVYTKPIKCWIWDINLSRYKW